MVAFSKLKPGDVVYDCHRVKMGNTTMSRLGAWKVHVLEVHADSPSPHVVASWNSNPPKKYYARSVKSWRRTVPKGAAQ